MSLLLKNGKEKCAETTKYLGNHVLVFAKGVYPYAYMTDRSKFDETRTTSHRPFLYRLKRRTADSARLRQSPTDMDAFRHSKFETVSRSLFALRRLTFERRFSTFSTYNFRRTPTGLPPLLYASLPRMERSPQTYRSRIRSNYRPQRPFDDRKQHAWRYRRHFQTSRSGQQPIRGGVR